MKKILILFYITVSAPLFLTAQKTKTVIAKAAVFNASERPKNLSDTALLELVQKQTWLPEEDFKKFAAKSSPVALLHFDVVQNGEVLGKILEVIEQPHQTLCRIDLQGKEAYIPLHEETLLKVDKKAGQVIVDLPDGLLDIYR